MQHHIQTLVKQFFQKDTLDEVSVHELQQFTTEYPYSAVGQFLFAKKLRDNNLQENGDQVEKSTLYFNNPIWSGWLIEHPGQRAELFPGKIPAPPEITFAETIDEEPQQVPVITEKISFTRPAGEEKGIEIQGSAFAAAGTHDTNENGTTTGVPGEIITDTHHISTGQEVVESNTGNNNTEEEQKIQSEEAATAENDDLVFESYHTIDYFASQGIKLRLEDLPKDKLGQQLKSFTDWLRSMKRIAHTENKDSLDEITNQAIQQIAEHSIAGKEIITEAMAEVWAKQGHREKAVAIYEKLSLLNPAKTSYFAARIEQIKAV